MNYAKDAILKLTKQIDELYEKELKKELSKHYSEYYGVPIKELGNGDLLSMIDNEDIILRKEGGDIINQKFENEEPNVFRVSGLISPIKIKLYRRL